MTRVWRHILAVWLALLGAGCASVSQIEVTALIPAKQGVPNIVVIGSSELKTLDVPLTALTSQVNGNVWSVTIEPGSDEDALCDAITAKRPDLLVTLGATATRLATKRFSQLPTVVGLVVNYRRLGIEKLPNVMVVALEPPPVSEFVMFRLVLPNLHRVLAFYSPKESAELVQRATAELSTIGVELKAVPVDSPAEIPAQYAAHKAGMDAVWFLTDSVVMNPETFAFLQTRTLADRMPFIASLSDEYAANGALMSVSVDLRAFAGQVLNITKQLFEQGKRPADIGVHLPVGTKLVVNMHVAKAINVTVPKTILPFVQQVAVHDAPERRD